MRRSVLHAFAIDSLLLRGHGCRKVPKNLPARRLAILEGAVIGSVNSGLPKRFHQA